MQEEQTPEFYKAFYEKNRIPLMQYENLREHFGKVVESVLGKDYYNMGMDVYNCDAIACGDIIYECNRSIFQRILDKIFR